MLTTIFVPTDKHNTQGQKDIAKRQRMSDFEQYMKHTALDKQMKEFSSVSPSGKTVKNENIKQIIMRCTTYFISDKGVWYCICMEQVTSYN